MSNDRPLLWEVMHNAHNNVADPFGNAVRVAYAAEIRALADWLIPDDPVPDVVLESSLEAFTVYMAFHRQRMSLRQQLLDEADRAERRRSNPNQLLIFS